MKRFAFVVFAVLLASRAFGQENCERNRGVKTPYGSLFETECSDAKGYTTWQSVSLGVQVLLEGKSLFVEGSNKNRTIWVYSGRSIQEIGCPDRLYLIDLSMAPPKVISFGVKKACNLFHWASWGDRRSVIALKRSVLFIYEDGRITPPPSGKQLWSAIEPPHAGSGLIEEDAVGFAEEVPSPKP